MWLVKAYKGNDQKAAAIALCRELVTHEKPFVQIWAKQSLQNLAPDEPLPDPEPAPALASTASPSSPLSSQSFSPDSPSPDSRPLLPKAGRAAKAGVALVMKGVAANLALASGATLTLLSGMILALSMAILWMYDSSNLG